jgi:hypothetical protein
MAQAAACQILATSIRKWGRSYEHRNQRCCTERASAQADAGANRGRARPRLGREAIVEFDNAIGRKSAMTARETIMKTSEPARELAADELDAATGGWVIHSGSQGVVRSEVKDSHDRYA